MKREHACERRNANNNCAAMLQVYTQTKVCSLYDLLVGYLCRPTGAVTSSTLLLAGHAYYRTNRHCAAYEILSSSALFYD